MTLAIVSGGILFPLVFLIGISAAIRNAGILFGGGGLSLCFLFFFFFYLKGYEDNLASGIGFRKVVCVWNLFP